jgi:predicted dienelactone hydrolase
MNRTTPICVMHFFTTLLILLAGPVSAQTDAYDPLTVSDRRSPERLDLIVNDTGRQRDISIRVYLPSAPSPSPVVLFSHGWGGSREESTYLGKHWASRGYVTVFLQHPGSDTSVWNDKAARERITSGQSASMVQNFLLRVKDVPAVLDQLEQWNSTDGHVLSGRMNLKLIGMSGHSFGAVTTQAVSGQRFSAGESLFTDARIDAAVIMSPSSPSRGTPQAAFEKVSIPWMLMTGTKDIVSIGNADIKSRFAVFSALPTGDKYELVLHGAEHMVFTDRTLPGDTEPRNPSHHRAILALSTVFWDTYLRENATARKWLRGDGPKSILNENDRWQMK